MLSRMGGHLYGVAKNANPVIVRLPKRPGLINSVEDYLDGVRSVVNDVGAGNKRAVLSMSWFYPRRGGNGLFSIPDAAGNDASDGPRMALRGMLRVLISKGVTPVTGSGNLGRVRRCFFFPPGIANLCIVR